MKRQQMRCLKSYGFKKADNGFCLMFYKEYTDKGNYQRQKLISFYHNRKTMRCDENHSNYADEITMQELKAINKKVKELGWLDE